MFSAAPASARSRWWLVGIAAAAAVVAAGLVTVANGDADGGGLGVFRYAGSGPVSVPEPTPTLGDAANGPQERVGVSAPTRSVLRGVLRDQQEALSHEDRAAYVSTWVTNRRRSREQAQSTYANITALGLSALRLQLVRGAVHEVVPRLGRRAGPSSWTASVRFESALYRHGDARDVDVSYTFTRLGAETRIQSIRAGAVGREPIWLQGRLRVIRTPEATVVGHDDDTVIALSRQLAKVRRDVHAVTGPMKAELLLFAPRNVGQWERALDVGPGDYDGLAAVTTTLDGPTDAGPPVLIAMNPETGAHLVDLGVQVLLAHELTHALTGAVTVDTPAWIVEGFAEYVAFEAVPVPVRLSAGFALREVRRNGLPHQLPTDVDFARAKSRDVAYAQSWVLSRVIARQHGERALVVWYEAMIREPDRLDENLHSLLGITESQLIRRWIDELRRLSSARRSGPAQR
ncbi:MAG: hypothetical protein H0V49_09235 [Nocardioidaceae bacterium]|nr:hypothetical protein [Nocardioidaceae bacterium]